MLRIRPERLVELSENNCRNATRRLRIRCDSSLGQRSKSRFAPGLSHPPLKGLEDDDRQFRPLPVAALGKRVPLPSAISRQERRPRNPRLASLHLPATSDMVDVVVFRNLGLVQFDVSKVESNETWNERGDLTPIENLDRDDKVSDSDML
jgi:hypothetical protein